MEVNSFVYDNVNYYCSFEYKEYSLYSITLEIILISFSNELIIASF